MENKENEIKEEKNFKDKAKDIVNDVKDDSKSFDKKEKEDGKGMAILAYIIPIIPYFFADKKNKYVRYHAIQGMNLLIITIVYAIIESVLSSVIKVKSDCGLGNYWGTLANELGANCTVTPWWLTLIFTIIGLGITVLCVIGIINVCNGKAKELPIVNKFKIIKK